jgi:acetolactate synthase-1/2/3 large subunit
MDVVSMFEPVTKWAQQVLNENTIPEIIRKGIRLARSEKPGAVLIELPEDIAKRETEKLPIPPIRFRRPVGDDKAVDRAWEMIKKAKRPVILAGNGCVRRRASKQLRIFSEKTGIGVISTFMAKGCVDMDSDQCLYTIGLQAKDFVYLAIAAADVIITLGFDMVEYHPSLWNPDGDKTIVHADFLPAEIDEHYHPEYEIIGDLAHTLWMFNERVAADGNGDWDLSFQAQARENMWKEISAHKDDSGEGPIRPQKVLWDVREAMDADGILMSDVGAHKMWIARHYQCHEPNTCLIPNGFCSMGFALPGAVAAALLYPDKHILSICGDAGFLMNVQEMETAKRLNCNMTVMVWEDNMYGLIAWKQTNEFGRHTDLSFGNPDWMQLASAFGWHGHQLHNADDLLGTVKTALAESGPSLIVLPIDYRENALLTERMGNIEFTI